ncbi:MAG: YeeE/YedE thiosulfate transporter family protein [Dongiaceae bacterium]
MSANFTPVSALIGGLMIGGAASLLWLALGRIAGISGILGRAMQGSEGVERLWRILFLVGLPAGAGLVYFLGWSAAPSAPPTQLGLAVVGGLLVGVGTRLGSGCTSGHGICGLARLSPRSLAATLVFMAGGMASVFVMRHLIGL